MDLKQAQLITKKFTRNGKEIIPAISDDWTYRLDSYYNTDDKIVISSVKLNLTISVSMPIQLFFKDFIFTKKILIDGNKLIGSFGFNKYYFYMEDEFNEALDIVNSSELNEVIPNNELIEFGLYLDDKGDKFVYLGNTEYSLLTMNTDWSFNYDTYNKKRYIVKYNNDSVDTIHTTIQKNNSRKFIKLIKVLRIKEKEVFLNSLFSTYHNKTFISLKKGGNNLITSYSDNFFNMSGLIKYDGKYGYYSKGNYWDEDSTNIFWEIDFDRLSMDIKNNSLKKMDRYVLSHITDFEIDKNKEILLVNLFLDYI